MILESIWNDFLENLRTHPDITDVIKKQYTNLPFLYIHTRLKLHEIEKILQKAAISVMKGKRLTLDMNFVRKTNDTYVFQLRFLVPKEKMFCCGNGCMDCIRFNLK